MYVVAPAQAATRRGEERGRSGVETAFRTHGVQRERETLEQQVEETRRRAKIRQLATETRVPKRGGTGGRVLEEEGNGGVGGERVELRERSDEVEEGGDEVSTGGKEERGEKERQQCERCEQRREEVSSISGVGLWDNVYAASITVVGGVFLEERCSRHQPLSRIT